MKKLCLMAGVLLLYTVKSQVIRYEYETRVNPDTVNLVNMKVEKTFLDVDSNHSLFASENFRKNNSLKAVFRKEWQAENDSGKKSRKEKKKAEIPYHAETSFPFYITKEKGQIFYHENIFGKDIYYPEDRKIQWKILPEMKEVSGHKAQKAIADFAGRRWTAWFTEEIPAEDGPYKFSGLPGLIVRIQDENGDYIFELSAIKKLPAMYRFSSEGSVETSRTGFHSQKVSETMLAARDSKKISEMKQSASSRKPPVGGMPPGGKNGPPDQAADMQQEQVPQNSAFFEQNTTIQNPIELKEK